MKVKTERWTNKIGFWVMIVGIIPVLLSYPGSFAVSEFGLWSKAIGAFIVLTGAIACKLTEEK